MERIPHLSVTPRLLPGEETGLGDEVGERWLFEVSRSLQFGVGVVVTRGVVGFAFVG